MVSSQIFSSNFNFPLCLGKRILKWILSVISKMYVLVGWFVFSKSFKWHCLLDFSAAIVLEKRHIILVKVGDIVPFRKLKVMVCPGDSGSLLPNTVLLDMSRSACEQSTISRTKYLLWISWYSTHMLNTVLTKKTINCSYIQELSVGFPIMCSFKINVAIFCSKKKMQNKRSWHLECGLKSCPCLRAKKILIINICISNI